ncbi:hypothetical protein [Streptacidiphilus carbonis]|uniref:hypothetical protein n=1 Tax=Streptacidiphilus carbonis TaxID=105422 RepID=UPI0005A77136|nr:hypothetical protein [Streptacidiphilus carbonis]
MTRLLTQSEAEVLLDGHSLTITQVLADGWARWRKLVKSDTELGAILSNRTRASIVYDCIRHAALTSFVGAEDVVVSEDRGFLLLSFSQRIILRFKKYRGATLRTSSTPTRQALEYGSQVLPGMESLTHLIAGYLPDEVGIGLDRAAITCPTTAGIEWVIELDLTRVVGGEVDERDLAPVTHVEAADTTVGTIIRPRRAEQDELGADQQTPSER